MSVVLKILCLFGFHKWNVLGLYKDPEDNGVLIIFKCLHCKGFDVEKVRGVVYGDADES